MKKDIILEIFCYLKGRNIVSSESEFSEHWLGYSESYMRKLRQMKAEPSLGSVAICGSRLLKASEYIRTSPTHTHVADKFLELSERCHKLVNENAVELELASRLF